GALAVVGLAYWGSGIAKDRNQLVTLINNRNQRAFLEMVGNVQNMEVLLSKGIVSGSPKQRMLIFADVWQQSYSAQENLTQVPMAGRNVSRTARFLTQTGDFAWSLAKKYARGQSATPRELAQLNELHRQAGFLAAELNQITKRANDGLLTWGEIRAESSRKLAEQPVTVPDGLTKIDKNMEEFPTLIYDGPFSDHITARKPAGLTGSTISSNRAGDIAKKFVEAGSDGDFKVVDTDNVRGTIPAFRVYLTPQNTDSPRVYVDISKKGGHVLSSLSPRDVNSTRISGQKATTIASNFLAGQKVGKMIPTYMVEQRNMATVIFEYQQNGVLIYPDLIKVKVALDNGEIIGYEATQFYMNHRVRKLPAPKVSAKEARAEVNPQLKIQSRRIAVIPLESLKEIMAYEFRGSLNGDVFIVYINAQTGNEERILKVIDTNGGPVTM
ncbi:MAG TPA: germination protein YpeB, partial [Desulfobacteria bacterium]|nr:germination protein YpeB [Desulfobacteria bacterium]